MSFDRVHDAQLLDALEALVPIQVSSFTWRVTRAGRPALRGSVADGRWNLAGEFEVLYTSLLENGALAEVGYRLQLEPIWPSRLVHEIHRLKMTATRVLDLTSMDLLDQLGADTSSYESHSYEQYQRISAAAHFLEVEGILVPNARHSCNNLVLFFGDPDIAELAEAVESRKVDWNAWRAANRRPPSRRRP